MERRAPSYNYTAYRGRWDGDFADHCGQFMLTDDDY